MTEDKTFHAPPQDKRVPADSLRNHVDEVKKQKALEEAEKAKLFEEKQRKARIDFMQRKFTDEDYARIKSRTGDAVHAGETEIEIMHFPAQYLSDNGRAVNNAAPNWRETLTGYAASFYEAYKIVGEPDGYKLTARILDYPGGKPGNVGLYLNW